MLLYSTLHTANEGTCQWEMQILEDGKGSFYGFSNSRHLKVFGCDED